MSNYVKSTDFAAKDTLTTGNPLKLIKGTEINDEFNNLQTAIATKADSSSPTFSGNPTAPTQAIGNNSTRLANTAFVQQEISDAEAAIAITGGTIDGVAITGGTVTGLATDLAVADGGTGASTFTANSVVLGNGTSSLAGNMVAPGTSGNVLKSNGTTWESTNNIISEVAQSASSVTSIDFTGIPNWAKRITVMLNGVGTNGTSSLLIQLGDAGGFETTGYNGYTILSSGTTGRTAMSTGFILNVNMVTTSVIYGAVPLSLFSVANNTWIESGVVADTSSSVLSTAQSAGSKSLSATLDRIRITTVNGTDTFDAGSINIMYE